MNPFFTDVKKSVSLAFIRLKQFGLLALATVTLTTACEPSSSSTDEAQTQVTSGNGKLQRMEQIDTELRAAGVSIKHPKLSTYVILNKTESQLLEWRKIVHEYIGHAEEVLKIADRPDVAFGEKQKISDLLSGANRLLAMIETEIGNLRHPKNELDSKFWTEWTSCREWTEKPANRQMYGIEFVLAESQQSVRAEEAPAYYARLGREKRRTVKRTATRHLECLNIEEKYTLHFEPNQNPKDETSRIARIERERKHIETIIESLSVSPLM
ncbi:MAG: hypothetical protein J0L82_18600 [Deltaproteobacteria bacterium]|jgi:hypothetical protein|nr:hypothetical protein [Deltaproteobacteria bacterium]